MRRMREKMRLMMLKLLGRDILILLEIRVFVEINNWDDLKICKFYLNNFLVIFDLIDKFHIKIFYNNQL